MMVETHILALGNGHQLQYYQWGQGDRHLLSFHGFGQNGNHFEPIAHALDGYYTVYSFDLFFHGKSHWVHGEQALTHAYWGEIMQLFLREKKIDRFCLAGYSLGGKFALATLHHLAGRVDRLFLMAPDGIQTSFWYNFATYPLVIRRLFKYTIDRPGLFFGLTKLLSTFHLMDEGLLKFAHSQMETKSNRHRVYYSWIVFRKITFNPMQLAQTINQNKIYCHIFLGKYDNVITESGVSPWVELLDNGQMHLLEAGHKNVITASAVKLKKHLPEIIKGSEK